MGYLKQIHVENFKSWRGKQMIGPFMRFTCIIGPNGSGKSNVMDALSFVIGERASALRVKHIKDLIHGANIDKPVSNTGSVTMCYCDDNGEEIIFCRRISGNSSEYSINGVHVTLAKYMEELGKIGIVTKARNCLVFQGAVESIAMMNPMERTKMFERICQSSKYAEDYEKKKGALRKAKDDNLFHFNKKKTVTAERKQASQEKLEAQKYQSLVDDLNHRNVQLSLFQLYHNEKDISDLGDALGVKQQAVAFKNGSVEEGEQAIKSHKREHGQLTREQQHMEKEIRAEEQNLSLCQSQFIKAKVNTSHHQKKAEEASATLHKGQKQRAKRELELADIRQDIAELDAAWGIYEREKQEQGAFGGQDIQLEEEQMEKYRELKELVRSQATVLCQQANKLNWEVLADSEKIAFHQCRKKEVEASIKNHQNQIEDFTHRAEKLEEYTNACNVSLEEYCQQETSLAEELQLGRERSQKVNQELGQVLNELGNAGLDHQESRRLQQRKEVLESLCRLYPDTVYGRLVDLCSPIHKKYQLAVTKVFGHYLNAIVVASEKVARECILYIKEERAGPETFLPIDYLEVFPLNERLREVRGAKMIMDVVQCNSGAAGSQLRKVLQFVCGNAIVFETIKEAGSVAFSGPQRLKTVALDGTLFNKSGVISGGSSDLRSKARCWDEKYMKKLKERKEQLTAELRTLMQLKRKESELKQIQVQAQGVQTRLKYTKKEMENIRKKNIPNCQAEISCMESKLTNLDSQIQMQQESMEVKEAEIKTIKERMDQMENLVFADFCAEIGVDHIGQYEQEHLKEQSELDRKRLEFESHRGRLTAQLDYEQGQAEQQQKKLRGLEATIAKEEHTVAEQRKEEEKLLDVVDEEQNKLLELNCLLLAKKSQIGDTKVKLDQENKSLQEAHSELKKLQRELIFIEATLEQKRLAKHNLLLVCKVQCLALSLLSGSLEDISQVQMDPESESTTTSIHIYEREAQLVIDYSGLESQLKRVRTGQDMQAQLDRLREGVYSVEKLLQRTIAPNLKALEKMRDLKDKFQEVVEDFDASIKAARKCNQEFEQLKAKRFHAFDQCFKHVSIVIDQIYKRLCRNTSAQAILCVDNPDEPYLGGVNYSCTAPGKRFMSMDILSGGEKTIAAMALLFAIHSYRPSPFFILDEVDAALDNSNIGKVTSFIREESSQNMQVIVISLKEEFYSRSDALVGVYPEFDEYMFSGILTLDLRPYPLNQDGEDTEMEP